MKTFPRLVVQFVVAVAATVVGTELYRRLTKTRPPGAIPSAGYTIVR